MMNPNAQQRTGPKCAKIAQQRTGPECAECAKIHSKESVQNVRNIQQGGRI